jgi:Kdo2-lipid IVA lauroyltransferase/acyltransferase
MAAGHGFLFMDGKNRLGYFLEYLAARAMFGILQSLPASWGRAVGRWLGRTAGRSIWSRTRLARDNMRIAFPQAADRDINRWVRECWENLGEASWEFARTPRQPARFFSHHIKAEGLERLQASYAQGKGVLLFTAHYTNWEVASHWVAASGFPLAVVARRMKNPYVNDFVTRVRSHLNIQVFLHKNAVRESIRWLKQGRVLGLLIDQRITEGGVRVPFLGRPAHTTSMPALLALRLGCPIHPVHCWREPDGLHLRVDPAMDLAGLSAREDDITRLTAAMTGVVESWVRERPPLWLWIHNRWK